MTLIRDRAVGQDTEQSLKPVKRHRSLFRVCERRHRGLAFHRLKLSASFKYLFKILRFYTTLYLYFYFLSVCVCVYACTCPCSLECEHICEDQGTTSSIRLHLSL